MSDFLERYRAYLGLLARLQVDSRMRARIDLSGAVQQTLFEAHQVMRDGDGHMAEERVAWLRKCLANSFPRLSEKPSCFSIGMAGKSRKSPSTWDAPARPSPDS